MGLTWWCGGRSIANPGFVVEEFQVTGMLGRPALDGVLEAIDEGFALRLSDGSLRVVPTLTSECAEFIGKPPLDHRLRGRIRSGLRAHRCALATRDGAIARQQGRVGFKV
jgi:hypothetical protein